MIYAHHLFVSDITQLINQLIINHHTHRQIDISGPDILFITIMLSVLNKRKEKAALVEGYLNTLPLYDKISEEGKELLYCFGHDRATGLFDQGSERLQFYIPPEKWWHIRAVDIRGIAFDHGQIPTFSALRVCIKKYMKRYRYHLGFDVSLSLPTPGTSHSRELSQNTATAILYSALTMELISCTVHQDELSRMADINYLTQECFKFANKYYHTLSEDGTSKRDDYISCFAKTAIDSAGRAGIALANFIRDSFANDYIPCSKECIVWKDTHNDDDNDLDNNIETVDEIKLQTVWEDALSDNSVHRAHTNDYDFNNTIEWEDTHNDDDNDLDNTIETIDEMEDTFSDDHLYHASVDGHDLNNTIEYINDLEHQTLVRYIMHYHFCGK